MSDVFYDVVVLQRFWPRATADVCTLIACMNFTHARAGCAHMYVNVPSRMRRDFNPSRAVKAEWVVSRYGRGVARVY